MRQQPRMPAGESGNREPDVCCKGIFPFKFMMNDNAKWLSVLTANGVVLVPACGGRSFQDDVLSAERPNPFSGVAPPPHTVAARRAGIVPRCAEAGVAAIAMPAAGTTPIVSPIRTTRASSRSDILLLAAIPGSQLAGTGIGVPAWRICCWSNFVLYSSTSPSRRETFCKRRSLVRLSK